MNVTVITPAASIVSLDEAKRHLRVEHAFDNEYIESLVAVATAWLDAPDGWLGRALGEQTLEATFPVCAGAAPRRYPYPPFLALVRETPSPDGRSTIVRWKAGYAPAEDGKSTVPAPIRHAILLMVGHLYAHRDAVSSVGTPAELPMGVEALLAPYRIWRV